MIHPDITRWRSGTAEHAVAEEFPDMPWRTIERVCELAKTQPSDRSTYYGPIPHWAFK
jgi:hypothetical protein